jgi:hypothetical protein
VFHDFGELTHEDVEEMHSVMRSGRSLEEKVRSNLYSSILAALAVGILLGYLSRRN